MESHRQYVTGHSRLELAGQDAGLLRSAEGGEPYCEVVREPAPTPGALARKRPGPVHYADVAIECDLTPDPPLADWIVATLGLTAPLRDGAVVELDATDKEISRLTFRGALIREIEFPALDAGDKRQPDLTLRLAPASTRRQVGSGARPAIGEGGSTVRAKSQTVSGFRLTIDGVTGSPVSRVEPLVVRQMLEESRGEDRSLRLVPAGLEVLDLVVTAREAADWYAWRDAFMIDGKGHERTGTLEYLAPDSTVQARLELGGLGIYGLVRERTEDRTEGPRLLRASMYCESLRYVLPGAASPATLAGRRAPLSRVDAIAPLTARGPFVPS